ncbi:hypothetical protein C8R43DRAFT_984087 [Mycena crocata]|nr:hypothetical protein C8R43DRAFT_984087 [Mycena crocata]
MVLSPCPLPQELIDIIIDAIQDDRASLKTCSYVSFPFKKSSQRHLFSHITLLPPRSARRPTQCQKLHEILLETPHLASYSTSLEILEGYQPSVSGVSVKLPWVTSESALELVLPLLPLRRFSLFCSWPGSLLSLALPATLRTTLYDVIKSDTLTSLTLGRIIFKPADFHFFLTGCTGLKELALFAVSVHSTSGFEADDEEKIESSTHRAQLDSFTAESDGEILDLLLSAESPVDLQCLRTLSLHGYLAARHLESLIQRPHATLQHFSIKELFDDSIDFDFTTVQHEHLRSLYIAPRWSQNMGKLLQKCSPRLERIMLELSLPDFAADQWTEVDNLLARPEMVHLCAVVIKVHPGFEGQCWDQDSELIFNSPLTQ